MSPVNTTRNPSRIVFHSAWALGVVVFMSVGWMAVKPDDPVGAVSLVATHGGWATVVQVFALATVVSAIGAAMAGRTHAGAGAFVVAMGLAAMSLQGSNMTHVLMERGQARSLSLSLMTESLFWCAMVVWSLAVSSIVVRWLASDAGDAKSNAPPPSAESRRPGRQELWHIVIVGVVALVLIRVFMAGGGDRAIRHGQACFAVGAAFYLAAGRAQAYFPTRSTLWSWLGVPVVCIAAFLTAWLMSTPTVLHDGLATVPRSAFLRILPITYASVGTAAVLLARWRMASQAAAS